MEITGGTPVREVWYRPQVPVGNRSPPEGVAPIEVLMETLSAGEIRKRQTEALAPKVVGRKVVFSTDSGPSHSELLLLLAVKKVRGLSFKNLGPKPIPIGERTVDPGKSISIETAKELLDASNAADSAVWNDLVVDIIAAFNDREALDAGLIPT